MLLAVLSADVTTCLYCWQVVAVCVLTENTSMLLRVWDGTKIPVYVFGYCFGSFCTLYIYFFSTFTFTVQLIICIISTSLQN